NLFEVRSGSQDSQLMKARGPVVVGCGGYQEYIVFIPQRSGRPINKQSVDDLEDVDVVQRGPVRDEGASGSRRGARGSKGKGAGGSGDASGSIGRGAGSLTKVSKVGGKANCSNCKNPRHNKASCTKPVVEQTPKPK
ncbi:hypothetical protein Tco_0083100, partial [Tanacetum coccineum]